MEETSIQNIHSGKLTYQKEKNTFEDVVPVENTDIPLLY